MLRFFHPVSTFSTTGKTKKGRILQDMALRLDRMLIEGIVLDTVTRMREIAAQLDAMYPRTRRTIIDYTLDQDFNGVITASPDAGSGLPALDQDYFRITFNTVAGTAAAEEALKTFTLDNILKEETK